MAFRLCILQFIGTSEWSELNGIFSASLQMNLILVWFVDRSRKRNVWRDMKFCYQWTLSLPHTKRNQIDKTKKTKAFVSMRVRFLFAFRSTPTTEPQSKPIIFTKLASKINKNPSLAVAMHHITIAWHRIASAPFYQFFRKQKFMSAQIHQHQLWLSTKSFEKSSLNSSVNKTWIFKTVNRSLGLTLPACLKIRTSVRRSSIYSYDIHYN